jgi:ketosteroid isomerase-like protein
MTPNPVTRNAFFIDIEDHEASNRPVAQDLWPKAFPLPPVLPLPATVEKSRGRSVATNNLKSPGETMKIRSVVALAGLAISFVLPVLAQEKDSVDPKTAEQLKALSKKTDEANNNNDAAALAALYTEDAVLVTDTGPIYGRESIEKHYADVFQKMHFSQHLDKADQNSPHIIGTAGNEAWSNGGWTLTIKGENWGPKEFKGNWVEIYRREGDTWKKRLDMWNVTPAPAPATTPSPTASPGNQ